MVARKTEAVTPAAVVGQLLRAAGEDMVLVGGQALGFWVQRFDLVLPQGIAAITSDTDFLVESAADREAVERFARDPTLIPAGPFWHRRWPTIRKLMSATYVVQIERRLTTK